MLLWYNSNNEIIYDFFDVLKSRTKGYASFDYEIEGYAKSNLVKLDVLLNGDMIDALSFIIHTDKAYARARKIAEKLKENIPRQMFEIPVQITTLNFYVPVLMLVTLTRLVWLELSE